MCTQFTDDDVGKTVRNADGDEVGIVTVVEGDVVHVEPDPGILDSIKAAIGWDEPGPDTVAVEAESVAEVTGDAVRLRGDLSGSVGAAGPTDEDRREEQIERARERTPSTGEPRERDRADDEMAGEERGVDEAAGPGDERGSGVAREPGQEGARTDARGEAEPRTEPDEGVAIDREESMGERGTDERADESETDRRPRERAGEGPTGEPAVDEPADDEMETDAAEGIEDRERETDRDDDEDDVAL